MPICAFIALVPIFLLTATKAVLRVQLQAAQNPAPPMRSLRLRLFSYRFDIPSVNETSTITSKSLLRRIEMPRSASKTGNWQEVKMRALADIRTTSPPLFTRMSVLLSNPPLKSCSSPAQVAQVLCSPGITSEFFELGVNLQMIFFHQPRPLGAAPPWCILSVALY